MSSTSTSLISVLTSHPVKEGRVGHCRASNNQSSEDAWAEVLKNALLFAKPTPEHASEASGLEVVSTITKENRVSIVFRRNVGELTVSKTLLPAVLSSLSRAMSVCN
jgi:hypothetical protein